MSKQFSPEAGRETGEPYGAEVYTKDFKADDLKEISTINIDSLRETGLFSRESHTEIRNFIKAQGWTAYIDALHNDQYHGIDVIQHTLYRMGGHELLPDAELDSITAASPSAFIELSLRAHRERRESVDRFAETADPNELIRHLRDRDMVYWNTKSLNERINEISMQAEDIYMYLIEKQAMWEDQFFSNYDGENTERFINEMINLDEEQLLARVYDAFKLDALSEYVKSTLEDPSNEDEWLNSEFRQQIFTGIFPSEIELVDIFKQSVRQDEALYDNIQQLVRQESEGSFIDLKDKQLSAQVFPILFEHAKEAHPDNLEMQTLYISHCGITALSHDTYLLSSPHGTSLEVIAALKSDSLNEDEVPTTSVIHHLVSQSIEGNDITSRGIACALLSNWEYFPIEIQEEAVSYGFQPSRRDSHHIKIFDWVFEEVEKRGYSHIFPEEFVSKVSNYYTSQLEKASSAVESTEVINEQYLDEYLTFEYGHKIIDVVLLNKLLRQLTPDLISQVEQKLSTSFSELDSREAVSIFGYLADMSPKEFDEVCSVFNVDGLNPELAKIKIRSFVSLHRNGMQIDDLRRLEEKDISYKHAIYNKYVCLVDSTRELKSIVDRSRVSADTVAHISHSLLDKAEHLIASQSTDQLQTIEQLDSINEDVQMFTSAFKTLRSEGLITDQEAVGILKNASFESVSALALSPGDRARMLEIFDAFWKNEPVEFSSKVRARLEASFSKPETSFYILRHEGMVVGYARVDDKADSPEPHIYFGSFNVDGSYGGVKIGEFIYRELIKQSIKKHGRIEADCDPRSDISKFYLRNFVATEYYVAEGVKPSLHIVYDVEQYAGTVGASLSQEKIISHAESSSYKSGDLIIREINLDEPVPFPEFETHRIMTRYVDDKNTGKLYGVFEYERQPAQKAA